LSNKTDLLERCDKGLMGTTLRYPYQIRDAKEYFDDIPDVKVEPDMLKLAEHILQSKAADFDPSKFIYHYEEAVVEMLKKKQAGLTVSREHAAPRPQKVVNLMDALRRSIAQEQTAPPRPAKGRKHIEGQARCCFRLPAKPKRWPRQSQRNGRAPDRKLSVDPCSTVAPIAARKSRRRFENHKIELASEMPPGAP
jgi:DNA end-binding protein Ku